MKATNKNGVFKFELDGYAVELYKENEIWLDKVHTLFRHVINRKKSIKFSEAVEAIKKDIQEAKEIETTILNRNKMKASYKNGVFRFELDGYAVELYKENDIWLDKVYTLFGHVINRISSEKSIKFSELMEAIKKDIREAKEIEKTIFKNV